MDTYLLLHVLTDLNKDKITYGPYASAQHIADVLEAIEAVLESKGKTTMGIEIEEVAIVDGNWHPVRKLVDCNIDDFDLRLIEIIK